jgi:cytochrome c553
MRIFRRLIFIAFGLSALMGGYNSFAQPAPQGLDAFLKWNTESIEVTVTNGTPESHFAFSVTNISSEPVTISSAAASCFCTVADLPEQPWKLAPGSNGLIHAKMNLVGRSGVLAKDITVTADKGIKFLHVQTIILPEDGMPQPMTAADRERNQKMAQADRQAVFKGDCARCHAEPSKNKYGEPLFVAACDNCHGPSRNAMVPDLHKIAQETNAEFWKNWIAHGKSGTLMPAFSVAEGGILSDEQINSLVGYLVTAIPSKPAAPAAKAPTPSH